MTTRTRTTNATHPKGAGNCATSHDGTEGGHREKAAPTLDTRGKCS
jgi:hypothetical protein